MASGILQINDHAWDVFYENTGPMANQTRYVDLTYIGHLGRRVVLVVTLIPIIVATSFLAIIARVVNACVGVFSSDSKSSVKSLEGKVKVAVNSDIGIERIGNTTNYYNKKDLTLFINDNRFDLSEEIPAKYTNYKILGNEKELQALIEKGELSQVLPYIWAEKDLDFKIEWLRAQTEILSHPVFFLELSSSLVDKAIASTDRKDKIEWLSQAIAFYFLGLSLVGADVACVGDRSAGACVGVLGSAYALSGDFGDAVEEINDKGKALARGKLNNIMDNIEKLPSPAWVMSHGLAMFRNENTLKPQSEWSSLRKSLLEQQLKAIEN